MRQFVIAGIAAAALCVAQSARAEVVLDLGGGWQATIQDQSVLDLVVDYVSLEDDLLVLQKFATFASLTQMDISFEQTADDANTVSTIVITDEFVFNNSGTDWNAFSMNVDGDATFDAAASASFSIDPYTDADFAGDMKSVLFSGGTVADSAFWTPGLASGGLYINVDLSGDGMAGFRLGEMPVPAPSALIVFGLAGLARSRRRR